MNRAPNDLSNSEALQIALVGTGGPIAAADRRGPCLAVFAGRRAFLVDTGPGAWNGLAGLRLPGDKFSFILLTHFHSDHIGDLGEVNMQTWAVGRAAPLVVYGPPGVDRVAAGFQTAYELDSQYRLLHHGRETMPPAAAVMKPQPVITPAPDQGVVFYDRDGLKIIAFEVDHRPVEPAYGYRIEYRGRTIVISGDTAKCDNMVRFSKGADLLVHSALSRLMVTQISKTAAELGRPRIAKITTDILEYQTDPVQAAEIAETAGVKMLAFVHLVPPPPNRIVEWLFMRGVKDVFSGRALLGRDGLAFRLPAGDSSIEVFEID